jgi:hypothetical protein
MVCFQTKHSNLGKFWRALDWKTFIHLLPLEYFMDIWGILWPFGTFCIHLVHFVFIWYILYSFGTFCIHLVHFVFIWYILYSFGTFFRFGYHAPRKIWQPWWSPNKRAVLRKYVQFYVSTWGQYFKRALGRNQGDQIGRKLFTRDSSLNITFFGYYFPHLCNVMH